MKLQQLFEIERVGDVALHPALEDLYRTMSRTREGNQTDFRNYDGSLDTRYFGDWEGDDGSGDYDHQTLTDKTGKFVDQLVKDVEKRHSVKIDWFPGEKNYIVFRVE